MSAGSAVRVTQLEGYFGLVCSSVRGFSNGEKAGALEGLPYPFSSCGKYNVYDSKALSANSLLILVQE
jgi:hypothetical protein